MEKPSAPTWPAPGPSTRWCTGISTRNRFSASTTSWARRRHRTFWPSVSPMASLNRYGTVITSTTCRSMFLRPSVWNDRVEFYEATGAFKDMIVTHLFQILGFMAMEPPTALESQRHQRREEQGLPVAATPRCDSGRTGPICWIPRHPGSGSRLRYRDVRGPPL